MSLVVQWLRPLLPMQGVWVQSLGRELDFTYLQQQTRQSNKYVNNRVCGRQEEKISYSCIYLFGCRGALFLHEGFL